METESEKSNFSFPMAKIGQNDHSNPYIESTTSDTSPTLRHSLQQSHNKGLYYGFRDAILSRLLTIIKRLVHHAVYCISLSCNNGL